MLCSYNPSLESANFIDNVNFTKNDPCIFVVYPPGAAGDLLISIIDKHYLRTGCQYYGINNNGKVMLYTTDNDLIDIELKQSKNVVFDQQWFYNLSNQLSQRNLNYSLLDQVIFGCHLFRDQQITYVLDTFSQAKVIQIYVKDQQGHSLIEQLQRHKLNTSPSRLLVNKPFVNERVLPVPFGCLFNPDSYSMCYDKIINFLNLPGKLISFDYVDYYLNQQPGGVKQMLVNYSKTL
jgi:hypothetical protein